MERLRAIVLSHHPSHVDANFGYWTGRQLDHARIKLLDARVAFLDTLGDLPQRVLNLARLLVVQVFGDLSVGERTSKPGAVPSQKRHEHEDYNRQHQVGNLDSFKDEH